RSPCLEGHRRRFATLRTYAAEAGESTVQLYSRRALAPEFSACPLQEASPSKLLMPAQARRRQAIAGLVFSLMGRRFSIPQQQETATIQTPGSLPILSTRRRRRSYAKAAPLEDTSLRDTFFLDGPES